MSMPMINSPCRDISDVTPRLPGNLQTALIFPNPICLGEMVEVPGLTMSRFKRIYLLEKVKVALVASFERLVGLFATKDFLCALGGAGCQLCVYTNTGDSRRGDTSSWSREAGSNGPRGQEP